MTKKLVSLAGCILAFAAAQVASAVPLTGNIDFAGGATLDSSNLATATSVLVWNPIVVVDGTGSFSAANPATPVTFTSPWVFGSGKAALWQVVLNGFTYTFDLTSSTVMTQNPFLLGVVGSGIISSSNPAETSTVGSWSFSTQNASGGSQNTRFSFSATSGAVPDGGTTALLVGAGLMAVSFVARRRQAA